MKLKESLLSRRHSFTLFKLFPLKGIYCLPRMQYERLLWLVHKKNAASDLFAYIRSHQGILGTSLHMHVLPEGELHQGEVLRHHCFLYLLQFAFFLS